MSEEPEELDIGEPVGTVRIGTFEMTTCWADWGGWHWYADGFDESHAREHLRQRLAQIDPFFGGPDYGRFGFPIEGAELSDAFPAATRRRIAGYLDALDERWARGT
jgi:hypothetical protein